MTLGNTFDGVETTHRPFAPIDCAKRSWRYILGSLTNVDTLADLQKVLKNHGQVLSFRRLVAMASLDHLAAGATSEERQAYQRRRLLCLLPRDTGYMLWQVALC
jgi:hypothetical protein